VDVANALNSFLTGSLQVLGTQLTEFVSIERQVVVVPEPISNKLLISRHAEVLRRDHALIAELDADVPMVVIRSLWPR
jgi:hypothetical protein